MEGNFWEEWDKVAANLENAKYVFAKTMPTNPHYYTLRKTWNDKGFVDAVNFMRANGYEEWFGGRPYTQFNVNGWKYWTMGEPINKDGKPWTILINRKHIERAGNYYDYIADEYDDLFNSDADMTENHEVLDMVDYHKGEKILDIGCGTGLFLDCCEVDVQDYIGIDVSEGMLNRCIRKHGEYDTRLTAFEDFYAPQKYDKIISLFGAFGYIPPRYIGKVKHLLNPGGKALLMVYGEDYHPATYEKMDVEFNHEQYTDEILADYKTSKYHGYTIIEVEA